MRHRRSICCGHICMCFVARSSKVRSASCCTPSPASAIACVNWIETSIGTFMKHGTRRSLHWWISVALIAFGLLMVATMTLQSLRSQALIEHRVWRNLLESVALNHTEQRALHADAPLPHAGILRSWLVYDNGPAPGMPAFLQ